ncbi:hypothetical protein AYO21_06585 [Fonsecaea monophora]|uniref:Uncharacterized protein n=1 Tax=Fonsecaea monophora TaxID=254056 RepID=A0A177F700_9EURO|nr:hypothetical protein AYO21_06585 [Fonsecaea monophora]KAH0841092.1 hypothetical protein FOPE_06531 [Fonsecaea pedrosoi]OAG39202.1 hypothetical protein AYO21_06585 [Fonsecaea monophora]
MSSTTSTLPDDAFRSYVLDFLRHVSPAALNASGTAHSELEALAGEFYETSRDIHMQELLLALHGRYDLINLGFFEKSTLDEFAIYVHQARGKLGGEPGKDSGCGKTPIKNPTTPPQAQTELRQIPVRNPKAVMEDLVGISSHFPAEVPMPAELDPRDLGLTGEAEDESTGVSGEFLEEEDYVVGWKTEFLMLEDGPVLVYKESHQSHQQAETGI